MVYATKSAAATLPLEPLLPRLALARMMSWFTIGTELGLSVALSLKPLYPIGIWFSLLLHCGMLLFTGSTFTLFFYGMTAAMLSFVEWPSKPMPVIYDGDCGFCDRTRRFFRWIDLENAFRWEPSQTGAGGRYGISSEVASQRVYLISGDRAVGGFRAFRSMLLYNPAAYLITYVVLAAPGPGDSTFRNVLVPVLLFLFSPLFTPIGEAIYRVIARNRHRLSVNSQCKIDINQIRGAGK